MGSRRELAAKLTLIGFVLLFVYFFVRPHGAGRAVSLGEQVPNFTLSSETGQTVNLSDFRGKVVVLNFWASWCGPCVDELPSLNRLAERYAPKGVQVIGVSVDEDPEQYHNFLLKHGVTFLTLRNPNKSISERWGTYKLPESYIISRDGHLLNKVIGGTDWGDHEMTSYFDNLVGGS
jgi:cytochrome c biogenesis protein CcmG/thiol:disulfide interchange protein DsbE